MEPGTFLPLQIKAFGRKKNEFHAGVKKCHLGNFFQNGQRGLCPASPALNNPSQELKKYF